jgi:hypothetical protein
MDEIGLKPFRPYNILLTAKFGKKVKNNIPTCESIDLRFFGVFFLEGSLQLLEVIN